MGQFGYAGNILLVNLSTQSIDQVPTQDYAGSFLGGRGIAAKVCWDHVPAQVDPFAAENRLVFATGPLGCVPVIAGSRWEVSGISPATTPAQFSYGNLGGRWGAALKLAGHDALVVHGISEQPVYLLLQGGTVEFKDASALWGKGAIETRGLLRQELGDSARVVAVGPAGENRVVMASLTADNDASGSGGLGAVMGSKRLKAIAIVGGGKRAEVAHPDKLGELTERYRSLQRINLGLPPAELTATRMPMGPFNKIKRADPCYGCPGCYRTLYEAEDGTQGKYMCNSAMFYQHWAATFYGKTTDVPFFATKLADNYGLDTKAIDRMIHWLRNCYQAGILTEDKTGLPLSKLGSMEFIESFVKKVSLREGFGDLLATGLDNAARSLGPEAMAQTKSAGHVGLAEYEDVYSPRLYTMNVIMLAMEPRLAMPQLHEVGITIPKWVDWVNKQPYGVLSSEALRAVAKRFWGSELAVDFSTYEGKALAAKMIQDREYAKACLILCDHMWPIKELADTENHVGDATLESQFLSAVTGEDIDEAGLNEIGERVFNLQRAIQIRQGRRGRQDDVPPEHCFNEPMKLDFMNPECLVPGKDGEVISRKGAVIDMGEFERMMTEYYALRHWDEKTGLQRRRQLENLGLREVADDLEQRGLLAGGSG